MVVRVSVVHPGGGMAAREQPSITGEYLTVCTSLALGKVNIQRSRFLLNVCHFHTIVKLKNPKSNPGGTICIYHDELAHAMAEEKKSCNSCRL